MLYKKNNKMKRYKTHVIIATAEQISEHKRFFKTTPFCIALV